MGNCLVTKLKGSIDNKYLRKLGKIGVYWDANYSGSLMFYNANLPEQSITIVGNGYFTDESYQQNLGKTITVASNNTIYAMISGECYLELNDPEYALDSVAMDSGKVHAEDFKARDFSGRWLMLNALLDGSFTEEGSLNDVTMFRLNDGTIDVSVFNGMTTSANIDVHNNSKCYGDISVFENANLNSIVYFNNTNLTGDVAYLSNCLAATNFQLQYTDIYGTLESLAAGLFNNGKHSGSIPVTFGSSKIRFNGILYTGGETRTMEFSANSVAITNGDSTTYATYNGSTWSYN